MFTSAQNLKRTTQFLRVAGAATGLVLASVVGVASRGDIPRPQQMAGNSSQDVQHFSGGNVDIMDDGRTTLDDRVPRVAMKNPGRFDDAYTEAKGLLGLDPIEGLRLNVDMPLPTQNWAARTDLGISVGNSEMPKPAHATCMIQLSDPDEGFVVMGQTDSTKRTVARVAGPLTNATTMNAQVSWDAEGGTEVALADVVSYEQNATYGGRYMYHVQAGNVISAHYMQGVSPTAGMGIQTTFYADSGRSQTELKYGWEREAVKIDYYAQVSDELADEIEEARKRKIPMAEGDKEEFCFTASNAGSLSASYHRRVNRQLAYAADYELKLSSMRGMANAGLQFKTAHTTHSVVLSSEGVVHASTTATPTPFVTVELSTMLDHSVDKTKLGLGIKFGPNRPNF